MVYIFWRRLLIIYFFVVLINGLMQGGENFTNYSQLKKKRDVLSKAVGDLQKQNTKLNTEIERISNSSEYAKKVFKEKYHILEQNEQIYFFE